MARQRGEKKESDKGGDLTKIIPQDPAEMIFSSSWP